MFNDIIQTSFGAELHILRSTLTSATPVKGAVAPPLASAPAPVRSCIQLQVHEAMLASAVTSDGGFVRLGCLRGASSRIGFAMAHSLGHLAMAVFDLGAVDAKAMVQGALADGRVFLALHHGGRHSVLGIRLTDRMRAVFEESLGAPPCSFTEFTEGLFGLTEALRDAAMYRQLDVDPLKLRSIRLSVCLPDAEGAPHIELTRLVDIH